VGRARRPSPQTAAVIQALAVRPDEWRHGYDIGAEVGLASGSLYPILMRLADRGLLAATWEEEAPHGRPARHLYRLTPEGRELAAELAEAPQPAERTRQVRTPRSRSAW
jgi:PadR family transcriptional regulator, regulatory protein PadR